jgi:glycosyltransferase involved in cell wall biosynthesis
MTRRPTLSLIVPTHREDRPLRRCLESVQGQLRRGDEVIVVGDTYDGDLPAVEALVREFGHPYRYVAVNAGHHDWGHSQVNAGIALAQGDYIHVSDDDDVWTPDALTTFRKMASAVRAPVPFLFRFKSYYGPVFWLQPGLFARNFIGGHCLLAPNDPSRLGQWAPEYSGDYDYVEQTVNHYGGAEHVVWCESIVVLARPA